ncbi:MAG: prolipoprotein diacylglyceryl transferase [Oscillospiraceae bacterium]|nr:prolipoprotein diacylglyceryl transferase [Oscillospiraceae bacterium]MBR6430341.1 prolipoprotein diacylglyceryl transferase [Oscillospiraceae bacterium]
MSNAEISFPLFGIAVNPSNVIRIGSITIHWYGVIIAVGFLLAVGYALKRAKEFGFTQDDIIDMLLVAVPLAVICARLYYVIFMPQDYFGPGKWINIVKIWEGGLAIYGGLIGAVLGVILVCRRKKLSIGAMLDIGGIGMMIGQAIGRWGNFMNREAFGAQTDLPWKMGLTLNGTTTYVHPTFLYESLWNAVGFVLIHFLSKKRKFDGQVFLMYIGWYGLGRFFIEGLRTDSLYIIHTNIRVSQLLAIVMFLAALVILIASRGKHDPAGLFCNRRAAAAAAASESAGSDITSPQETTEDKQEQKQEIQSQEEDKT